MCTHTHIHIHIHVHTHTHTHIYIYIYIYCFVKCLWEVFVWVFGVLFLSCASVSGVLFSAGVCVCVCDLLIF